MSRFYSTLLALRRSEPALWGSDAFEIREADQDALLLRRREASGADLLAVIQLRGEGRKELAGREEAEPGPDRKWKLLLTSEDEGFAPDPRPPQVDESAPAVEFARPGVVVLKSEPGRARGC
jgi:hypothetical protein